MKDPTGFRRNVRAGEAIRSVFREARPADPIRVLINGQPVPAYGLGGRILVDAGWPGRFGRSDVSVLWLTPLRDQTNERPPSGDVPPALSGPALAREGRYAVRLGGEVVPAYALRGRVYIPVGRLSALGATVVWDQSERAVRVTLPGR